MANERMKSLSENIWIVFIARIAMVFTPIVATALVWFGTNWLETKFETLAEPLKKIENRVEILENGSKAVDLKNQAQDIFLESDKATSNKISQQVESLGSKVDEVNTNLKSLTSVLADRDRRANTN